MSCKIIPIGPHGKTTVVDSDVAERIKNRSLFVNANGYAYLQIWESGSKKIKKIGLNRFVMNAPSGMLVDHKNHDVLDNRRANLRLVSKSQNNWNVRSVKSAKSGFMNVEFLYSTYRIRLRASGNIHRLCGFRSSIVAAIYADRLRRKYHDEYTFQNFTNQVNRNDLRAFFDLTGGRIFTLWFSKRTDGSLRKLTCRINVSKGLAGKKAAYNFEEHDLYAVYDVHKRSFKAVPLDRVIAVRIQGVNWRVAERRKAWAS